MKQYILAIAILFAATATTFAQTKTADTAKAKPVTHKPVKPAVTPVKKDTTKKVGTPGREGDKNKI